MIFFFLSILYSSTIPLRLTFCINYNSSQAISEPFPPEVYLGHGLVSSKGGNWMLNKFTWHNGHNCFHVAYFQAPYYAGIVHWNRTNNRLDDIICGGGFINYRWVLTLASCDYFWRSIERGGTDSLDNTYRKDFEDERFLRVKTGV